jgi:transposase
VRKSGLSKCKQARLTQHFVASATARTAAALCRVNRKTAAYYFHRLREIVALELKAEGEALVDGEIEVDESFFGGNRKGRRGQGGGGNTIIWLTQAWWEGLHEDHSRCVVGNFVPDHGTQDCAWQHRL